MHAFYLRTSHSTGQRLNLKLPSRIGVTTNIKIIPVASGGDMPKIAIVTDSTAYIPSDLIQKYNLSVTPQVLIWGEETFQDGVDIQPDEFYARLKTTKVMPTTSQVTPITMKTTFEGLIEKGLSNREEYMCARMPCFG